MSSVERRGRAARRRPPARSAPSWGRRRAAPPSRAASWRPRARPRSTVSPSPPRTTTRPTRSAPSPSATIISASWRSSASSASPSASSSSRLGRDAHAARARCTSGSRCRWSRAGRRRRCGRTSASRVTPSSRSAVSGVERRVGLHEAQHRREVRRDHPRALALGAQPHRRRAGSSTSSAARFSNASVVWIAAAKSASPSRRSCSCARLDARAARGRPAAARRSRRSRRRATSAGSTPVSRAAALCVAPALSKPGTPVAAFALPELASDRAQVRRGRSARGTAAPARRRRPERVKRAALVVLGRVADEQAEVERAARLEPAATPAARKPPRQPAVRARVTCVGAWRPSASWKKARRVTARSPSPSGEAEHQVEVLHRLRGGALPEVVDRGEHDDAAVVARRRGRRCGRVRARARRACPAARSASSTNGSSRVGVGEQRVAARLLRRSRVGVT